jgi:hypothetical protein
MTTIRIDPSLSPRLITVESPAVTITLQTLVNLIRDWEELPWNLTYLALLTASGKQDLGSGVRVGITSQLNNAQLTFEARPAHISDGTCTTGDARGRLLTDAAANFVADGVAPGATVVNLVDLSVMTVLKVVDATHLLGTGLQDGTDNQWDGGDTYKAWNAISCSVTGGNLTAVDELGVSMDPIVHTAFTHVSRESSTSASMTQLSAGDLDPLALVIWQSVLENGYTAQEMMRLMSAIMCGKTTIDLGPPVVVTFKAAGGAQSRVTATMTGSERTGIVLDVA